MAGVDTGSSKGRDINRDINMVPFIDLLMVTVAFLLITAVWVTYSRVEATAQVPGQSRGPDHTGVDKTLHLYVKDGEFVLAWKHGGTTVSETHLDRAATASSGPAEYPDLAKKLVEEWQRHGGHRDASDGQVDRCVLHTENTVPFREVVAVMDAVYVAKREMVMPGGRRRKVNAFAVALAAR